MKHKLKKLSFEGLKIFVLPGVHQKKNFVLSFPTLFFSFSQNKKFEKKGNQILGKNKNFKANQKNKERSTKMKMMERKQMV